MNKVYQNSSGKFVYLKVNRNESRASFDTRDRPR
nr:MAG TPA: hypothetical protein [Caudoviricetes sp.]